MSPIGGSHRLGTADVFTSGWGSGASTGAKRSQDWHWQSTCGHSGVTAIGCSSIPQILVASHVAQIAIINTVPKTIKRIGDPVLRPIAAAVRTHTKRCHSRWPVGRKVKSHASSANGPIDFTKMYLGGHCSLCSGCVCRKHAGTVLAIQAPLPSLELPPHLSGSNSCTQALWLASTHLKQELVCSACSTLRDCYFIDPQGS